MRALFTFLCVVAIICANANSDPGPAACQQIYNNADALGQAWRRISPFNPSLKTAREAAGNQYFTALRDYQSKCRCTIARQIVEGNVEALNKARARGDKDSIDYFTKSVSGSQDYANGICK